MPCRFNSSIGNKLLNSTVSNLIKIGVRENNIRIISVSGSLEIPLAAQKIASKKIDAIIALGIVLKGDTCHFEIVSSESHRALMDISLKNNIPHIHVCGGNARCSTCRVMILENPENVLPPNEIEQKLAAMKVFQKDIRLACQAKVTGPVKIRRLLLDQ